MKTANELSCNERYEAARVLAGLSLGQAKKITGILDLDAVERGDREPPPLEVLRMANTYGVKIDWLLGKMADLGNIDQRVMTKIRNMPREEREKLLFLLAVID